MRPLFVLLSAFAAFGCHVKVQKDMRPSFEVDPAKPFVLALGRGSGWDGLDTVAVREDGSVELHRYVRSGTVCGVETATLSLSRQELVAVLRSVEQNDLMHLHRLYSHTQIADGTQWVLLIRQGGSKKAVYFNNHFPSRIVRFARCLDNILTDDRLGQLDWQTVPAEATRAHEKEFWDSIK